MASFLAGLGQGLGAAASGMLGGQIKGEAEAYRRQQGALDRDYKRAALAARKKELDPNADIRKRAGMTAQQILRMRADPGQQAFFESEQGRPFAQRLEEIGNRLWGIHIGSIDPEDIDTYALSFAPVGGGQPAAPADPREGLPFLREPGTSVPDADGTPRPACGSSRPSILLSGSRTAGSAARPIGCSSGGERPASGKRASSSASPAESTWNESSVTSGSRGGPYPARSRRSPTESAATRR